MKTPPENLSSRRTFLRAASCAAVGTLALKAMIRDLRFINTAAAQSTLTDYKALVCIFLQGGNDANNLVIPLGADYANYAAIRQVLALPQASALPVSPINNDGHQYGLHPSCPELQTLFGEGKAALLFNVGTLVYPISSAQYKARAVAVPPQLFSHSDQVTQWQTSIPDQPPRTGWGGRVADLIHPLQYQLVNGVPTANSAKISLCTSLAGANTFEVGNVYQKYDVSTTGAVALGGVTGTRLAAMQGILGLTDANLQRSAYAGVVQDAIAVGSTLNGAIDPYADLVDRRSNGTSGTWIWNTGLTGIYPNGQAGGFPKTTLGGQLKMIARLIASGGVLNMKRQIFFAAVGGYDTHSNQTGFTNGKPDPTVGTQAGLFQELSSCMLAFQRAMEQVAMSNAVTSFTASDFGRTFPANGSGSDHGWGSHHVIVGGAVQGQRTYGTFPVQQVGGPDDTSTGRWIPRTSVDEYSATLAKWFGVGSGDMGTVFPNLYRFPTPDLGFMRSI